MSDSYPRGPRPVLRDIFIAVISSVVGSAVALSYSSGLSVATQIATRQAVDTATSEAAQLSALHAEAKSNSGKLQQLLGEAQSNARLFEGLAHAGNADIARELSRNDSFIKKFRADTASAFVSELPSIALREFNMYETWPTMLPVKSTGRPMLVCLQTDQWRGQGVLEETTPVFLGLSAVATDTRDQPTVNLYGKLFSFPDVSSGGASVCSLNLLSRGNWEIRVTWFQGNLSPTGEPVPESKKVKITGPSRLIAVELPVNFH